MGNKYCPTNLFLKTHSYDDWCKNKEEYADLSPIPPLEDEKKVPLKGYKKILFTNHGEEQATEAK